MKTSTNTKFKTETFTFNQIAEHKNVTPLFSTGYLICSDGTVYAPYGTQFDMYKEIKGIKNHAGYLVIRPVVNSVCKTLNLHRLVGMHFLDGYAPTLVIDHLDADKSNPCSTNLAWVTYSENSKRYHARKNRAQSQ
jgi:hypothetical protein